MREAGGAGVIFGAMIFGVVGDTDKVTGRDVVVEEEEEGGAGISSQTERISKYL